MTCSRKEEHIYYGCPNCTANLAVAERRAEAAEAKLAEARELLATWESGITKLRQRSALYAAGMAAEADNMIAGLRAALAAGGKPGP